MTSSASATPSASTSAASTRSYGSDPAQVYDVLPPAAGAPAVTGTVVVVHGGFWRAQYDREHARPEAAAFAGAGYHVVLAEYRRVGMPGGGVPGTLEDVRDLLASVSSQPDLPKPIVLVGHSAGGQLVAWAAGQPWARERGIVGVVSLAGVVDLGAADRLHLGSDATRDFVGSGPGTAAWTSADPMSTLPPKVPVRLVNGADDDTVPHEVADAYVARARAAGGDVTEDLVAGADHFAVIDPTTPAFAHVLTAVHSLL
ncbi:alpha/beta hydrolase [Terrabacter aerolatus]|uniref:Lipase n=1 Tax=Terrabacter aerolatus TaxID=422442 RepID=A0A512CVF1_9MICO|nr:alpha/beta fold hydrolase [Terrabacter aerolatus]GEO28204.1 lipase [Terrabacter aerolatus]